MAIRATLLACGLACATALAAGPARAGHYSYTQVAVGANPFACGTGINDQNHVVGEYYGSGSAPFGGYVYYGPGNAFSFQAPGNTGILDPCAYVLSISNIDKKNLTVNTYASDVSHGFGPFTYSPVTGHTTKLPSAARLSMPTSINASGDVVGAASGGPGAAPFFHAHGFIVSGGTVTEFDPPGSTNTVPTGIGDNGTVVGYFTNAAGTHGFIHNTNGAYVVVDGPGSTETEILSVNSAGEVAGKYYNSGVGHFIGFTRSGTNLVSYQFPGAGDTEVVATLTNGVRIGNYTDTSSVVRGFSYLGGAYSTLDPTGGAGFRIQSVNSKGNFVGNTGQPLSGHAYLAVCPGGTGVCLN